jgi:hypothetical protein
MKDNKMSFDEFVERELHILEAKLRENPNPKTYSEEEFFAEWNASIEDWESEIRFQKCIS